eukprot:CAMPEP_0115190942 /NCGR_PEP_ID=MMETSP0270-20121206/12278_1 /TAXON_ID=71861 /ORGANISM="Scrippsiella trochoidea, Strain CCMP3099" /LENGTH=130 /DNA_ID=CAMNT_0002604155 /DNA_START=467 /DNA_END=859 /DNA_ORIENTATION=-
MEIGLLPPQHSEARASIDQCRRIWSIRWAGAESSHCVGHVAYATPDSVGSDSDPQWLLEVRSLPEPSTVHAVQCDVGTFRCIGNQRWRLGREVVVVWAQVEQLAAVIRHDEDVPLIDFAANSAFWGPLPS